MFSNESEKDESSSSNSSSTGSSSTSSSDDTDSSNFSFTDEDTKTTPGRNAIPYSLRPRKALIHNVTAEAGASKDSEDSQKVTSAKEKPLEKNVEKPLSFQDGLLQEMEEKRLRTIARFKNATSGTKTKDNCKKKHQTAEESKSKVVQKPERDEVGKFKSILKKAPIKKNPKKAVPSKENASTTNKSTGNEPTNQFKKQQQKSHSTKKLKVIHQTSPTTTSFVTSKKVKAIVNEEEEIILHLSSDDENLDPSEMVEAQLLEFSVSSESVAESNRADQILTVNTQSQNMMDNDLNIKSPTRNQDENQVTFDQEAETLVKLNGLMQMGIHLIPNKSTKKAVASTEETELHNLTTNEHIIDQPTQSHIEEMAECPRMESLKNPEINQEELEKLVTSEKVGKLEGDKTENLEGLCTSEENPINQEKHKSVEKTDNLEGLFALKQSIEYLEKLSTSNQKIGNREKAHSPMEKTECLKELRTGNQEKLRKSREKTDTVEGLCKLKESVESLEERNTSIQNIRNRQEKVHTLKVKMESPKGLYKEKSESQEKLCKSEKTDNVKRPLPLKVKVEKLEKPAKSKIGNREKSCALKEKTETFGKPNTLNQESKKQVKPHQSKEKAENQRKSHTTKNHTGNLVKSETLKEKTDNLEKPETSKEKPKIEDSVDNDKLNCSLEEGELVSDNDNSPEKTTKFEKYKVEKKIKRIDPKKIPVYHRNTDTSKVRKSHHDRFQGLYRSRRGNTTEPVASISKKSLSYKSSKSSENKTTNKKPKSMNKAPEKGLKTRPKNESITSNEKHLSVGEMDYQEMFDVKTCSEETHTIRHDYSKKATRKLSDYNFDILTKKFSANVYIAEIDSEVEKFLTFSPFEFLLDISPKVSSAVVERRSSCTNKSDESITSQVPSKNKPKPLNILFNQLVKAADVPLTLSPLQDLYSPVSTSRDYKRSTEGNRQKTIDKSKKNEKSEKTDKANRSKPISTKEKSSAKDQSLHISLERSKYNDHRIEESEFTNTTNTNGSKFAECKSPSASGNVVSQDLSNQRSLQDLEQDLEIVEGVIMLNAKNEEIQTNFEATDELMNYALIGSERVDDSEDFIVPDNTDNRKRKMSEEAQGEKQQEKKQKTQELLRNIDVDSFLKKLHGDL